MKNKILTAVIIIVGVIILSLTRIKYNKHNLKKLVGACMLAQKQTSESFNKEESRKYCEEAIKKKITNSK